MHLQAHPFVTARLTHEVSRFRGLLYGLVENGGPLCVGVLLIAPAALDKDRRMAGVCATGAIGAFGLAALGFDRSLGWFLPGLTPPTLPTLLTLSGLLGLFWMMQSARLIGRLRGALPSRLRGDTLFLVVWAVLAGLIYFLVSPFPAARRLGDVFIVSLLLFGRAVTLAAPDDDVTVYWRATAVSAACSVIMLVIALVDGKNVEWTARMAAGFMRENIAGGQTWHLTSLQTDRYFTREGIKRLELDRTELQSGDLLVVDEAITPLRADGLQQVIAVRAGMNLGVRVVTDFFRSQLPWGTEADTRPSVVIYRATTATRVPRSLVYPASGKS
jgi:hypothetical protein